MKLFIQKMMLFALLLSAALARGQSFNCLTPDATDQVAPQMLFSVPTATTPALSVHYVVDYSIIDFMGISAAEEFIPRQIEKGWKIDSVAGVCKSYTIEYMTSPQPYSSGNNLSIRLQNFKVFRPQSNADIDHLLVWQGGGGLAAGIGTLGTNNNICVSGMYATDIPFPIYSFNGMVIPHEEGHVIGLRHTHSCTWPGGALDGCAGFTEGNCSVPSLPSSGTIMSYCHLQPSVLIDFLNPHHPLVQNLKVNLLIQNGTQCEGDPPPPPVDSVACDLNSVLVEVMPDIHYNETSWNIVDGNGNVVANDGPYSKSDIQVIQADSLCLEDGCYTFTIRDVDGLGGYGGDGCDNSGAFYLSSGLNTLLTGVEFTDSMSVDFCFGNVDTSTVDCDTLIYDELEPMGMGSGQDNGLYFTFPGNVLLLQNNAWKGLYMPYEVTPNTRVEFEVNIEIEGEIHAIAFFPNNMLIHSDLSVKVGGTQNWGEDAYMQDYELGQWYSYDIPIGQVYEEIGRLGFYEYFVFINDMDLGLRNAASIWRGVVICEDDGAVDNALIQSTSISHSDATTFEENQATNLRIYPNPATDTIRLPFWSSFQIYSLSGNLIKEGESMVCDVSDMKAGAYVVAYADRVEQIIIK